MHEWGECSAPFDIRTQEVKLSVDYSYQLRGTPQYQKSLRNFYWKMESGAKQAAKMKKDGSGRNKKLIFFLLESFARRSRWKPSAALVTN